MTELELLERIYKIATGEIQVAFDDTEALATIAHEILDFITNDKVVQKGRRK